jgi:CheY-like chemotaxis protein
VLSVLIIDDQPEVAEIIEMMLEDTIPNINIDTCYNAIEGHRKLEEKEYDLVCTDYNMPMMDGMELIKAIRHGEGPNKNAIILLITGYKPSIAVEDHNWHDVYFITKPFDKRKIQFYAKLSLNRTGKTLPRANPGS